MANLPDEDAQSAGMAEDETILNAKDKGGRRRVPDQIQDDVIQQKGAVS